MQEQQPQPSQPNSPPAASSSPLPPEVAAAMPPGEEDADLEFRPAVKYAGIAVLLALLLGVEYATYRGGYSSGYSDAAHSGEVEASINRAAVENLLHFMQAASADDETLLSTIAERDEKLSWIREPDVRREAEWMLAQALLDRGRGAELAELLSSLFAEAPASEVWARRAHTAARALAAIGDTEGVSRQYPLAINRYEALGKVDSQLVAMNEYAALLATSPAEGTLAELDAMQKSASALGEGGRLLRADILVYMGHLCRENGKELEAIHYFGEALEGVNVDDVPALAGASVCYGLALMERGDTERAETLLRVGLERLGDSPVETSYLVAALRALARIELQRGRADAALAHLYRAEGVAIGRFPEQHVFWANLYDQRGWVNKVKGMNEAALADFERVIHMPEAPEEVKLQSLEGAGDCCITQGNAEQAVNYLSLAAELRGRLLVHDTAALGRVYLLLAQAQDTKGDTAAAASAYGRAAELLAGSQGQENEERYLAALMGQAYALGQLEQWKEAVGLWELVLPLVAGKELIEDEAKSQLAGCRRALGGAAAVEEGSDEEAEEAAQKPAPAPRRSSRSRSRRRR